MLLYPYDSYKTLKELRNFSIPEDDSLIVCSPTRTTGVSERLANFVRSSSPWSGNGVDELNEIYINSAW